jgi:mycothiol synthase
MAALRNALHRVEIGTDFTDESEMRTELTSPDFDLAKNAILVFAPSGDMVGSALMWAHAPVSRIQLDNYVHPEWTGRGIGTFLLDWSETRAAEIAEEAEPGHRVVVHHGVWLGARPSELFFEERGYVAVRYFNTMEIQMSEPPPEPSWPAGIEVRSMELDRDERAVYDADNESFADHFGYIAPTFDMWKHEFTEGEKFDPTLNFVATDSIDGGQIAGFSLCHAGLPEDPAAGHISALGVRPRWRRKGIALALLRHSFGEFFGRGHARVTLGVDTGNSTGALHLYEEAGMKPFRQFTVFEKVLVPKPSLEATAES